MAVLWQRVEGAGVFASAIIIYLTQTGDVLAWWAAVLWFFAPDLSFAAYLAGPRIGAIGYNTMHVYSLGLLVAAIATVTGSDFALGLGLLWVAHCGFDRMLGYGLKLPTSFQDTHLGRIGRD